jgi:hypothetical protein
VDVHVAFKRKAACNVRLMCWNLMLEGSSSHFGCETKKGHDVAEQAPIVARPPVLVTNLRRPSTLVPIDPTGRDSTTVCVTTATMGLLILSLWSNWVSQQPTMPCV